MLPTITSRQNPFCKLVRSLHTAKGRRENNVFLVEGKNGVAAALASGATLRKLLCAPDHVAFWQARAGECVQSVTPAILEYLSDAQTNPGVLALCALPDLPSALPASLLLVLDGVSDPGNVGTLIRTADAVAAGGVLATQSSADPFAPKAVRSSAGSIFHTALLQIEANTPRAVVQALQSDNIPILVATTNGETSCFDFEWHQRCALVLGHETRGVSKIFEDAATAKISIPIYGKAESLNVASAGAVLLYAWQRSLKNK